MRWLNNQLGFLPKYSLVFTEKEYHLALRGLKVKNHTQSFLDDAHTLACVRFQPYPKGSWDAAIVLIYPELLTYTIPYVCGMLAHEAVHIVQYALEYMGEKSPSKEFQAYMTQRVTTELIEELLRRKGKLWRHK